MKINFNYYLKLVSISNACQISFLPLDELNELFKKVREYKTCGHEERELRKKLTIELVKNITITHLLEQGK